VGETAVVIGMVVTLISSLRLEAEDCWGKVRKKREAKVKQMTHAVK
jgi:hypothetical protein